jgi:uncharacterized protein YbbC (DUF1343 family)
MGNGMTQREWVIATNGVDIQGADTRRLQKLRSAELAAARLEGVREAVAAGLEAIVSAHKQGVVKGLDMAIERLNKYPTVSTTEYFVDVISELKSDYLKEQNGKQD